MQSFFHFKVSSLVHFIYSPVPEIKQITQDVVKSQHQGRTLRTSVLQLVRVYTGNNFKTVDCYLSKVNINVKLME